MKKTIIILCSLVLLCVPLLGCLPSKPASTVSTKDTEQDSAIAEIKRQIQNLNDSKANDSSLKSLRDDIDARLRNISAGGTTDTYSKSQLYTKAEVDSAVAIAVQKLKEDQSWIKSSSGSSGGGGSPTGSVSYTTTPVAIPEIYSASTGSGQSVFYTLKIVNGSSTWQYVKPIITLSVKSSYSARAVTGITVTMSSGSCSLTGSRLNTEAATSTVGNFSVSPNVGSGATSTTSLTIIPITGCNGTGEYQVGAGQSVDILIQVSGLTTSDVTLWNVNNSISTRSL